MHTSRIFDVIIVGAGIAGLTSAAALKDRGYSVLVIEARSRLGGRIHSTTTTGGLTVDLGAQLIGDSQVRISRLVDRLGLTRIPLRAEGWTAHHDSATQQVVFRKGDVLPLSPWGYLDAFQVMWRLDFRLGSFRDDIEVLDRIRASGFIDDFGFTSEALRAIGGHAESELCASLDEVSAYELLDQLASVGGSEGEGDSAQWCLAEGMGAVIEGIAEPVHQDVLLDAPVSAIRASAAGYVVSCGSARHNARRLLVTVPPQLYGRMGLTPLLPEQRRRVIDGYVNGSVVKTILVFAEPWWRQRGASGRALGHGGPFGAVIDASPTDGRCGILVIFSTASWAKKLQRISDSASRVDAALRWLENLAGERVPRPTDAFSVDWNADPWALGGYASRRGIGGWSAAADLFHPHQGIHFAGSETADEWRSFAEGALQSAERATCEIERSIAAMP